MKRQMIIRLMPLLALILTGCSNMAEVKLNFMDIAYVRQYPSGLDDPYGFSADNEKIAFCYVLIKVHETSRPEYEYVELWWPKVEMPGYRRIDHTLDEPESWKNRCIFKCPSSFGNYGVLVSLDPVGKWNQSFQMKGAEYDWRIFWIPAQDFRSAVKDTGVLYVPPLESLPKVPSELLKSLEASSHEKQK